MKIDLTKHDGRPALRIERWFPHPPEKVWQAITEPDGLGHWFPAAVGGERAVGQTLSFTFEGQDAPHSYGRITAWEPPRLFEFTWQEDVLRFELRRDGDGCLMIFIHVLGDRATAPATAAGWHVCVDALAAWLDGEAPPPAGPSAELHQQYAQRFGLGAFPAFIQEGEEGASKQRVVFRSFKEDTALPEKVQAQGEYVVVLEGQLTLIMNGSEVPLNAGAELFVHPGIRTGLRAKAGTRSIHAWPATGA